MTNTSSNSASSRRVIPLNSAAAAHLAIMSSSSSSPYPPPPTNLSNPPPASQYSAQLAAQFGSSFSRYPISVVSTIYPSTRTTYYSHPLALSSTSPLNMSTSNTHSKSTSPKPKLPDYLADTSFAEMFYKAHDDNAGDRDPLESVALPTEWNVEDRCELLNVDSEKLKVNYIERKSVILWTSSHLISSIKWLSLDILKKIILNNKGSGKSDVDAAAIRANHPIPSQCGLFYFEVHVISKGKDGYIGIGFCTKSVKLDRLPGWENDSWGYHGDDGHSFCCSGTGKPYGPVFTTGDYIGCCLNFRDGTAFYTKNGKHLGIAFRDLKGVFYPSIGLRTQGESIEVNFGQKKFKFAIEHYMKEEKARLWHEINGTLMPPISSPLTTTPISQAASDANLTATVHRLVLSYLVHHGYSETAKAFSRDSVQISQTDNSEMEGVESENPSLDTDKDMKNRQRIRDAVLEGDIDHAIKLTDTFYPSVLPANDYILFQLRCRKLIEMLGACAGTEITLSDPEDDAVKVEKGQTMIDDDNAMDVDPSDNDSIDDIDVPLTSVKEKKATKRRKEVFDELDGLEGTMAEAIRFGYKLRDDYGKDEREEIKNALEDAASLLAYTDPRVSCVAHLLDPSGREPVANALNSAILVSQGKPAIPPLEKAYCQASVVIRELSRNSLIRPLQVHELQLGPIFVQALDPL
ncbi:9133_t:CDS:10 [Acaulospora morrowiae]|uniref:9133_t:CDS:1 n=1 Tax=Acaulospora morrowiae TaxID=94023 RepID=A0A9N9A327_9GLOM|nr:9133_t:CDS:10 [Acaulospora morrowiae]